MKTLRYRLSVAGVQSKKAVQCLSYSCAAQAEKLSIDLTRSLAQYRHDSEDEPENQPSTQKTVDK